jgi:hypothetical protein
MQRFLRHIGICSLILLGVIGFIFVHSELGVLNFDEGNHGQHDYCEILKSGASLEKIIKDEIIEAPVSIHSSCVYCHHQSNRGSVAVVAFTTLSDIEIDLLLRNSVLLI